MRFCQLKLLLIIVTALRSKDFLLSFIYKQSGYFHSAKTVDQYYTQYLSVENNEK